MSVNAPLAAAGAVSTVFGMVMGVVILGGGSEPIHGPPGLKAEAVPSAYRNWVDKAGQQCPQNVGPAALAAQLEAESHWNPTATSPVGATGIAQFMPSTYPQWGHDEDGNGDGPPNNRALGSPQDPPDAIMAQARYMCSLANTVTSYASAGQAHGDPLDLALAAYNAGPGAVLAAHGVPHNGETEVYVSTIRRGMAKYSLVNPAPTVGGIGPRVVEAAQSQIGKPYVWGGGDVNGPTGGGFDCSGLVQFAVFQGSGGQTALNQHLADWQARQGQPVAGPAPGSQINLGSLQPGDVIGFGEPGSARYHHIGIYVGGGQMVHAPDEGQPVKTADLTSAYWARQTWNVRRFG